jgi:uroporphyrinogen decarboxylase
MAKRSQLLPKERVRLTLNHEEADRVPLDFGGTAFTSISVGALRRLNQAVGFQAEESLFSETSQACIAEEEIQRALHSDFRAVTLEDNGGFRPRSLGDGLYRDEWGITWRRTAQGEGLYSYEIVRHPLAGATDAAEIVKHQWPDFTAPSIYSRVEDQVRELRKTGYALGGSYAMSSLFGIFWYLRGMEQFLMDLVLKKDFAHLLMSRVIEIQEQKMVRFLEKTGDSLDVFCLCGDLGTQASLLISPELFAEMIKPYLKRVISRARSYTEAKIFYHTCGNVVPLIEDLIDCGVEILNPVQVSAAGMDPLRLKKDFGEQLVFWGAIDTQHVLPHESKEQVEAEVKLRIDQLANGGGYVLAPVHNIQNDVPVANILAMYRAGLEYGDYGRRVGGQQ